MALRGRRKEERRQQKPLKDMLEIKTDIAIAKFEQGFDPDARREARRKPQSAEEPLAIAWHFVV